MTRQEAIDVAKQVLAECKRPDKPEVNLERFIISLLIALEVLKVDD